jgi:hypothetical protein
MPLHLQIINAIGPIVLAFIALKEMRDSKLDAVQEEETMPSIED